MACHVNFIPVQNFKRAQLIMSVAVSDQVVIEKVSYFVWLLTNTNANRNLQISLVPRPVSALGVLHHLPGSGGLPIGWGGGARGGHSHTRNESIRGWGQSEVKGSTSFSR